MNRERFEYEKSEIRQASVGDASSIVDHECLLLIADLLFDINAGLRLIATEIQELKK